jgi:hypothetical protein
MFGGLEAVPISEVIKTGHICHGCDEELCLTDEVALLQVVYPFCPNGHVETCAVDNGAGSFRFAPRFMHLECWEELEEDLTEKLEDVPPMLDHYGICDCSVCASDIRAWESSGLLTFGELRQSRRRPNGEPTIHFDECGLGEPKILCVGCIMALEEEVLQMWEDFSHNGECPEGTHARCWRTGECSEVCQEKLREYGQE